MAEASAPSVKPSADEAPTNSPSFLSALKASHEAIKLYLQLIALIAGIPAAFALVAFKWGMPLWVDAIICAIPAGLILIWLVPTWQERKNKQQAIALGIHGHIKDAAYFRLTPYDETAEFHRGDNVHEAVYGWLVSTSAPLLYLSGASGSGKSSIISAWVLPKLKREGFAAHVVSVRVIGTPISTLTRALLEPNAIWERPPSDKNLSLRDLLERAAKRVAPKKLLLFLDQFEEFLILAGEEQQDTFTALLRSLAETPIPNLRVLMILRSDYEPLLDRLKLPAFEQNRKVVPPFFERDAMAFLRASELQISEALESEILREARDVEQTPGLIRPITVNLFGLVLRRFETLPKNYGKGTLLRSYLKELIQRKEIRDFAAPILRCMMTGNGTKVPVSCVDIARTAQLEPLQVRGCLVYLANEGVVRELEQQQGVWEIAHDFIASLYHQILAGWRVSAWRRSRPWIFGGGIALWLATVFLLPTFMGAWQENREQDALIDLGFSRESCAHGNGDPPGLVCLTFKPSRLGDSIFAEPHRFGDSTLAAAAPHLKKLKKKYSLYLTGTEVENIDALKGVSSVRSLYLGNTKVKSINALNGMSGLRELNLASTKVNDIDALKGVSGLQKLDLSNTGVENIDALKGLSELQKLDLDDTLAKNIDALEGLSSLRELHLNSTHIKNIDALRGVSGLKTLDLGNTGVENIDVLKGLSGLENLYLAGTQVKNIDALKSSISLRELNLRFTRVENIDALKGLSSLRRLYLSNTRVENIDALKGLSGLETLDLSDSQVKNIDALKGVNGLERLDLRSTQIENIDALKGVNGLRRLDLRSTQVENIDALKGLSGLRELNLASTRVKNIDALRGLSGLKTLDLRRTRVENIDALKRLTGLEKLYLSGTQVKNIDSLKSALPQTDIRQAVFGD